MATLNISLPDSLMEFIEGQATKEGYGSAGEYLHEVIRDLQRRQAKLRLEEKLREAVASGPATPMTCDDWDLLERNVRERHDQAHPKS